MGEGEQVRALFHAFVGVKRGQGIDPIVNFRETFIVKHVFAAVLDVFHVALGDQAAFFGVDFLRLGVELYAGQVFVHHGTETKVVHGVRDVFARLGKFGGAVAWR